MIGIIDYDAGNIRSVEKALAALHEEAVLLPGSEDAAGGGQADPAGGGRFR